MTIRVFFVDDQAMVRAGFVMVVEAQDDMTVVGEAGDGAEALERLATTTADIVLMDVRMPRVDGVEATRQLLARADPPKVIVLTTFDLDEYAFAALQAGASGFLVKDAPAEDLLAAIRTVHRGDAVIAPSTTRRLLDQMAAELPAPLAGPDPLDALTDREREVLLLIARGASNAAIAKELFLSEGTVKTHVGRILAKFGMRDRVHAVIFAYEHRLVRPGMRQPPSDRSPRRSTAAKYRNRTIQQ
ncbi:response regulator transcription factor [Kitasatospora acidiphila]|uniref:Response regulator transcription factor n=1 Tax=Kitasatospora acidiphila TaxID=2567942 RepID=A0A540W8B8_9ACTN|nr:response regulator transcription factor [Kitasatospora acidiphila]TQF04614.1 response regulator transcription factor [Kitasatospora acidiphila]